jgi:benzaldehyde dehydrogenase (NAD)
MVPMFKTDLLIGGRAIEAASQFDRMNPLTGDVATRAAAATVADAAGRRSGRVLAARR